jgi:hypothetical protein
LSEEKTSSRKKKKKQTKKKRPPAPDDSSLQDANNSSKEKTIDDSTENIDDSAETIDHSEETIDHSASLVLERSIPNGSASPNYCESLLPEDIFSFFVFVNVQSWSFVLASLSVFVQFSTLGFLTADVIDRKGTADNPLGVPVNVEWSIRASQFLAMLIATISQDDILWSLKLLYNGYDASALDKMLDAKARHPMNPKRFRWFASLFLRLFEGCFGLAVTFMLVMRSESVRDLLLNFTATLTTARFFSPDGAILEIKPKPMLTTQSLEKTALKSAAQLVQRSKGECLSILPSFLVFLQSSLVFGFGL